MSYTECRTVLRGLTGGKPRYDPTAWSLATRATDKSTDFFCSTPVFSLAETRHERAAHRKSGKFGCKCPPTLRRRLPMWEHSWPLWAAVSHYSTHGRPCAGRGPNLPTPT